MQYYGTGRQSTVQNVSYTGTAGTITNGVGVSCTRVRVACTSNAWVLIDNSPTATTGNGMYMSAGIPEYFTVTSGQKVSAIQDSAGGTLNVTEII